VSRWQAGCGQKDAWEQQKEDMQTGVWALRKQQKRIF
jgi:hypothetical protein